ncbi:MAG: dolichyl-phosphate-mannose-protein mannosyltransferase [Pseudonocardiales bacterium]|nr:dolichyl-phosphate-mannose-protein mannosyltransferase [Pseudonocardiales bacterium]
MASPTVEHPRSGRPSRAATDDDAATGVEPIGEPPVQLPAEPRNVLGPPPPSDRLRGWLVTAVLTIVAAAVRFAGLGTPTDGGTPVFDEKHYVPQAWQMLRNGGVEDNPGFELVVHPPLGKQLIAVGEAVFGYDAVGWRVAAALASVLCVLLIVRVGRRLTRSTLLGGIAGVLLICDGLSHVQGRMGMLDVFSALFVVAGFTTLVRDRDDVRARMAHVIAEGRVLDSPLGPRMGVRWWRLATGVLLGLGCAVKWSGVYWVLAFAVLSVLWDLTSRRSAGVARPWKGTLLRDVLPSVWALALVPVLVYFADWGFWFASETSTDRYAGSNALTSMLYFESKVLAFHEGLTTQSAGVHPWESKPWSWFMGIRPMLYYYAGDGVTGCGDTQCVSAVMLIGTPALWWPALPVLGFSLWRLVTRRDWRYGAVLVGYGAGILPWFMDIDRQMFFFYMTPVVPFLVLATVLIMGEMLGSAGVGKERRQTGVLVVGLWVGLVVANFIWLWPILTGAPITQAMWDAQLWLPSWRA